MAFLTTRVQGPDVDDWKKLGRCLRYLRATRKLPLTLCCDPAGVIQWWIDASFAVHPDMRSHTGATMSLGKGAVYSFSTKQRINTHSSTEAELVGVNDAMSLVLWTRHFLEAQGFSVKDNVIFQDNESTMLLAHNGRLSSTKNTWHIDIRYYFINDHIKNGRVRVEHCPTTHMIADCLTKPLQGAKFREFCNHLLNISEPMQDDAGQECVETPRERERPALGSATVQQVAPGPDHFGDAPGPDHFGDVTTTSTPEPNVSPVLVSVHKPVVPVTRPRGGHAPAQSRHRMAQKGTEGSPKQRVKRSLVVADLHNPTITR